MVSHGNKVTIRGSPLKAKLLRKKNFLPFPSRSMKKVYSCDQNSQESKSPELFVSRNLQEHGPSTELTNSLVLYMACLVESLACKATVLDGQRACAVHNEGHLGVNMFVVIAQGELVH